MSNSSDKANEIRTNLISFAKSTNLFKQVKEEDGNTFNMKEFPGAEVILVETGPGKKESNAFVDTRYMYSIRCYTNKSSPTDGKKELINLAETVKELLLKNYRLNDVCWNIEWNKNAYSGKLSGEQFGEATRFVDVLFNCYAMLSRF